MNSVGLSFPKLVPANVDFPTRCANMSREVAFSVLDSMNGGKNDG